MNISFHSERYVYYLPETPMLPQWSKEEDLSREVDLLEQIEINRDKQTSSKFN